MTSNNLLSKLSQQLHVVLDDNLLLHLFRVQGGLLGVTMLPATLNTRSLFELAAGTAKTTLAK